MQKIMGHLQEMNLPDGNGGTETRTAIRWPAEVHQKTIERITRGVYFHHTKRILGQRVKVDVCGLLADPRQLAHESVSTSSNLSASLLNSAISTMAFRIERYGRPSFIAHRATV